MNVSIKRKSEQHVPYRVSTLELFGGVGAPKKAFINLLGADQVKSIDYVEVLNWGVFSYNKMYPHFYKQQSVTEWNLDVDILFHGSPCQDFSVAGKNMGGELGTDTRSSLLWETIDIIKNRLNKLPKVIIWENVKNVLSKKHKHTFDSYLKELEDLGYTNQWKVLNSKDFGIPQSRDRVFVVSIHNDATQFNHFYFDKVKTREMKPLSDFLETEVDKSYFIKQKSMINAIAQHKIKIIDNVVSTITTKQWRWNNAGVVTVPIPTFNQENYFHYIDFPNKTLPTITAGGANSRIKIFVPKQQNDLPVFEINGKHYNARILTERECWRLMGFTDDDFNKIIEIPKTAKYHLAGNSIVVSVLEEIFRALLWKGEN